MSHNSETPANDQSALERERARLRELEHKPLLARLKGYVVLSGPGWLQSALTLGGGSLSGSLYLGVVAGFGLLWLQPLAMILGIIMLSAIGYVTLSTGERPFRAINRHINPVLGWGWLAASMLANMVWALPQYSLATGVLQQNLLPGVLGDEGPLGPFNAKLAIVGAILLFSIVVTWSYGSGHWGVRLYEWLLKIMVAVIVACFIGVVVRMGLASEGLDWGAVFSGFVPDFTAIFRPAEGFVPYLEQLPAEHRAWWSNHIVGQQRDVLMTAFATAVGINMTFLLPYSMIGRGWGREHRELSIFDLSTGMFIPFVLATSCVVIASASRFHAVPQTGLIAAEAGEEEGAAAVLLDASEKQRKEFRGLIQRRIEATPGADAEKQADVETRIDNASTAERQLAAMLVTRDVRELSQSLVPLFGGNRLFADVLFGIGVLGMALSTITLLMLVSGFVVCEVLDLPPTGWPHRIGCLAATTGALGPFFWTEAAAWLAVPTSVFGLMLLPIAYITFFLMMNQRSLLGDQMPRGAKRFVVNLLMGIATAVALCASIWAVWAKTQYAGLAGMAAFLGLALAVHVYRRLGSADAAG